MLIRTLAFVFFLASAGCATQKETKIAWTDETVIGLRVALIDPAHPKTIQELTFRKGAVEIDMGETDGWVTSPIYKWQLIDGRLQIGESKDTEQWTLVSRSASNIVVRTRSGELRNYKILEQSR